METTGYSGTPFARTLAWDEELGAVAFSLLALVGATSTRLDETVDQAIDKVDRRVAETGSASSGGMPPPV